MDLTLDLSDIFKAAGFLIAGLGAFFALKIQVEKVVTRFETHATAMERRVVDLSGSVKEELTEIKSAMKGIAASLQQVALTNGVLASRVETHDRQIERLEIRAHGGEKG